MRARRVPRQCGAARIGLLSTVTRGRALVSGESSPLRPSSPSLNKHTAIEGETERARAKKSRVAYCACVNICHAHLTFPLSQQFVYYVRVDSGAVAGLVRDAAAVPGERGEVRGPRGRADTQLQVGPQRQTAARATAGRWIDSLTCDRCILMYDTSMYDPWCCS